MDGPLASVTSLRGDKFVKMGSKGVTFVSKEDPWHLPGIILDPSSLPKGALGGKIREDVFPKKKKVFPKRSLAEVEGS